MGNQETALKNKNSILITDLTSKYKAKVTNYETMINSMTDEQKKIFQTAINLYDIQLKQDRWDSYVGYALSALLTMGYYYNTFTGQWDTCMTKSNFVNPNPASINDSFESQYRQYVETLYPRQATSLIGISRWDILDNEVDPNLLNLAMGGEMAYEQYDLDFNLNYIMGGEQQQKTPAKKQTPKHPDIPVSPHIDVAELTKGDASQEKFIYAYTDSGVSKNKRDWRPMIMDRMAQQVMELNPPGNLGHAKPENIGYELQLPVVTWIGATTELLASGSKRLWLKGYIIPTPQGESLKTYVRAKAIDSISVFGGVTLLPNAETGISDVLDIDLKSIDISGKLKEGLNSGIVELAGEMHNPNSATNKTSEREEEQNMSNYDLSKLTLAELRTANPQLFGEMTTEIINSIKIEDEKKTLLVKAGEMDALSSQVGENPLNVFKQYQAFAGEMAEAVGLQAQGVTMPTMADITAKTKEIVGNFANVVKALNPAAGQTPVAKADELVKANKINMNTQAIKAANDKFNELTSSVTSDAIKNLVSMQYQNILQAKPESVADDYAATSIQMLEANVPNTIAEVVQNAQAIMQTGQQAGEMAMFQNLGAGNGVNANKQQVDVNKMTDEEYVKHLGYFQ